MQYRVISKIFVPVVFILILSQTSTALVDHSMPTVMNTCLECHPRALPTHVMSTPQNMPEGWESGRGGAMVCITCHDCSSGVCSLKKETPELCNSCHDCTKGIACVLGVAHLGSTIKGGSRVWDCLSCHDGYIGKEGMAPGITPGDHKVNVYYIKKKGYKSRPDRRIILPNGKVTCISCHNPYKSEPKRLVMSNGGSRLCLSCHSK